MGNNLHVFLQIAVICAVTILLRFLPFLIFREGKSRPSVISYLGNVLPYAVMGLLVVYCLNNISFAAPSLWAPELIAVLAVVLLHLWKHSTLLSIFGGTFFYMVLVQVVFRVH